MNNYGLDSRYFKEQLGMIVRDADNYTPSEMMRAMERLADVARIQNWKKQGGTNIDKAQ